MKKNNPLREDPLQLSAETETTFPELYRYLDENPVFMNHVTGKEINTMDIDNYLNAWRG